MANRRKQEDKHLKILRELVSQQNNKKCFDCGQRGPTYVNMTIGVFVCTSCSGLLRGLNPPHRIKSISMATFSSAEIEFLQTHGNEACRGTWLALWDSSHPPEPESREEQKVKDFLTKKYERKVWYSSQPRAKPQPASIPEAKPLKQLVGESAPEIKTIQTERQRVQPAAQPQPQQQQPQKAKVDLLADLGGDPFGSSETQQNHSQGFAAFGAQNQQTDIFGQTQNQSPFGDNLNFPSQQPSANPPFGGQATPFAAQPPQQQQQAFGNFSKSSSFPSQPQISTASGQSSLVNVNKNDPFGAITPPASSSAVAFDAFGQSSGTAQQANAPSNGSFNFFESAPQSSSSTGFGQTPNTQGMSASELDRYKALSELDDVFRGSNTQSVFSSSTANTNAMERTANQQPNPFMSPASGTSGIAMFQQQQQKAPNPFQGGGGAAPSQSNSWGGMPGGQNQATAQPRGQQQFSQASFGGNQAGFGSTQAAFGSSNQAAFGGSNQAAFGGGSQSAFGGNNQAAFGGSNQAAFGGSNQPVNQAGFGQGQGGFSNNQSAFGNQQRFATDKSGFGPSQGQQMPQQVPNNFPQNNAGQQQMFNAQFNGQQQAFNGQQQAFNGQQQNIGGQQFMGGQQGFGRQQMPQFQGQMQGQVSGQIQGQGQVSGQMPGQGQIQGQGQMPGQMNTQMQSQMPGGFGNQQQQQQQQFGTWGQSSNKGLGAFGMSGVQAGMVPKSTNPFM